MHRQTIASYDQGAERWRRTRRADGSSPAAAAAEAFRLEVGTGLILDLGCGPGTALASLGLSAVGLDASLGMLALARNAPGGVPLAAGDLEALPIASNCANGAFGSFSFQHLPREQFLSALRETARVLRPRGLLELWMHGDPGVDGVRADDDMGIGRWFTYWGAEELASVVPAAGLEIMLIDDHGPARRTRARRRA